ncbi:MAG: TolC family protein [Planctomycetales bacterium]|nr:TolC family protein [Planctomycetales bacterium]
MAWRLVVAAIALAGVSSGCASMGRRTGEQPYVASPPASSSRNPNEMAESSWAVDASSDSSNWVSRALRESNSLPPASELEPVSIANANANANSTQPIDLVSFQEPIASRGGELLLLKGDSLELQAVLASILDSYPAIAQVVQQRQLAMGQRIGAAGMFDTKLSAGAYEEPIGFYENFRHELGVYQPLYGGGQAFAGYRVGRGVFEPWYQERVTDESGEFKAGFALPLLQDNSIDRRRADLWQARIEVLLAEPAIQQEVIAACRDGAVAYWDWVAAGNNARIAAHLLELAENRRAGIQRLVDEGEQAAITLVDNQRSIASRRAKLFDAERKLAQTAIKLSLYFRDAQGRPVIPSADELPPDFPGTDVDWDEESIAISLAVAQRPEIQALELERRQLNIELAQAVNLFQPNLDVSLAASQDVGSISSSKGDKDELEVELGLLYSLPLQRRKALGKQQELQAKLAQNAIKQQFLRDKIATEVQVALVALETAMLVIQQAEESARLAEQMEEAERRKFMEGDLQSNLLTVNLREQASADAQVELVNARRHFFEARADYRAALGLGDPR